MPISARVKEVRKFLKLSQSSFGKKLGVSRDTINDIENERVSPKDLFIKHLCTVCNIREEWLRTGKGEMFVEDDNTLVAQLAKQYNLDDFSRQFIETYVGLPEEQRAAIKNFAYAIVKKRADTEISKELSPISSESHGLTEPEIEAEVKSYKQELEQEKSIATSSASHDSGEKTG